MAEWGSVAVSAGNVLVDSSGFDSRLADSSKEHLLIETVSDAVEGASLPTEVVLVGKTGDTEDVLKALEKIKQPFVKLDGIQDFDNENIELATIFVLEEFEGQTYETLHKKNARILGPPVVLHCARKGEPLPFSSRPLYCTSMLDLVLCFTGFKKEKMLVLVTLAHHMGATIRKEYTGKITHLVANSTQSDKFRAAVSMGTPIMRADWIYSAWERRNEIDFHIADEVFRNEFKVPPFQDCVLSFLGFPDEELRTMEEMTEMQGGRYLPLGDDACTHLVVENTIKQLPFEPIKKLFVVKQEWFWGSIQMDARAGESMYLFEESESPTLKTSVSLLSLSTPNSMRKRRRLRDTLTQFTRETDSFSPFPPRKRPSAEASISLGSLLDISNTPDSCGEYEMNRIAKRHRTSDRQQGTFVQGGKPFHNCRVQRWSKNGKKSGKLISHINSEIGQHAKCLEFLQKKEEYEHNIFSSPINTSKVKLTFEPENMLEVRDTTQEGETFQRKAFVEFLEVTEGNVLCSNTVIEMDASSCTTEKLDVEVAEGLHKTNAVDNLANFRKTTDLSQVIEMHLTEFQQSTTAKNMDIESCDQEERLPTRGNLDKDGDFGMLQKCHVDAFSNVVKAQFLELEVAIADKQMQQYFEKNENDEFQQSSMIENLQDVEMSSVSECSAAQSFTLWDVSALYSEETPKSSIKSSKCCAAIPAKQSARWQVAMELYQTESNYVDILTTIIQLFKVPLEKEGQLGGPILAQEEIKTIFGSIPDILDVHTKIKTDLEELILNWSENHSIGGIIQKYSKDLVKTYPPFVNFFEMSKDTIAKCERQKPRFHAFLKINQAKPECGRQSLAELLIRPVQRLPSVALLLNDLRKHTDDANPDKISLENAIELLKEVMTHINEDKRKTEGQRQIFDVVYEVDGCPANLLSSHRSLVQRVETIVLDDDLCDRGEQVTLFLFNDCLEIARKRHKVISSFKSPHGQTRPPASLKHIMLMPLSQIKRVLDIKETDDCRSAFALVVRPPTEQSNLLFSFQLIVEEPKKNHWLRLLCRHVANTICKADAENIIFNTDPECLEVNTKDVDSTLSRASRAFKKTSKKVTRAFSFTKTPKRVLQRALMVHSTPDTKSPTSNGTYLGSRLASTSSLVGVQSPSLVSLPATFEKKYHTCSRSTTHLI
ncbi:protein ECT2 isoform X2 [Chiloscyllium plagiosum]|uniref:protein ECT2 isoform X2 n=1 Tax=Chiloscyllium plagiosum TaxID=36176 RepID=UPI001CB847B6|nr:protein ECT2 isoform X2 [Chiloscyllium plagiosum]